MTSIKEEELKVEGFGGIRFWMLRNAEEHANIARKEIDKMSLLHFQAYNFDKMQEEVKEQVVKDLLVDIKNLFGEKQYRRIKKRIFYTGDQMPIKEEELKKETELFKEITGHDYNNLGGGFSFGIQPVKVFINEAFKQGIQEERERIKEAIKIKNMIVDVKVLNENTEEIFIKLLKEGSKDLTDYQKGFIEGRQSLRQEVNKVLQETKCQ